MPWKYRCCFVRLLLMYFTFNVDSSVCQMVAASETVMSAHHLATTLHWQRLRGNRKLKTKNKKKTPKQFVGNFISDNCCRNLCTRPITLIISTLCKIDRTSWRNTCHLRGWQGKIACRWKGKDRAFICKVISALLKSNVISLFYTVHLWSSC